MSQNPPRPRPTRFQPATPERDTRSALFRGWSRRCPACGEGALFSSYLDVRAECPSCRTDLSHQRADDGPAWATIMIAGHIMAPVMLIVFEAFRPEGWQMAIGFSIVFVALSLYLLPRIKGCFVGIQWAKRMHGFGHADAPSPVAPSRPAAIVAAGNEPGRGCLAAPEAPPIRHAATIVILRHAEEGPRLLMGQRGSGAVFMPDKFVFPGGALDPEDLARAEAESAAETDPRLLVGTEPPLARALRHAAVRELREETGLSLPAPDSLAFFFRAVTPPGRPRRFDARFFLADAEAIVGSPDDFADAQDELRFLSWLSLEDARALDLPFITEMVLAEIAARAAEPGVARAVPYFNHTELGSHFHLLHA